MADRKMQLTSRLLCEFLRENPGATRPQVAAALKRAYRTIETMMNRLEKRGYIERRGGYDAKYRLTGKAFPASADYVLEKKPRLAPVQMDVRCIERPELDSIFYNMVRTRSEAA
jgi:DNA-binding transcriptional MocR family regulator